MCNIEQHPLFMEELELEYQFKHQAEEQLKRHLDEKTQAGAAIETPIGRGLIEYLYDNLAVNIEAFLVDIETPKRGVKPIYYPLVLWLLDVYKDNRQDLITLLSLAVITEAVNGAHVQGTLSTISVFTCEHILNESALCEYMKNNTEKAISLLHGLKSRKSNFYRRYFIQNVMKQDSSWHQKPWDRKVQKLFGARLLEILIGTTDLFQVNNDNPKHIDCIQPTTTFQELWKRNKDFLLSHAYQSCPMIMPPMPWNSALTGGYYGELQYIHAFIRTERFHTQDRNNNFFFKQYKEQLKYTDLSSVLNAVNSIQKTPWKINSKVLRIAEYLVSQGGDIAGLPQMEPFSKLPTLENPSQEELKRHKKAAKLLYEKEASRRGKALRVHINLRTAQRFEQYDKIYFPHNIDFRGRIYPIPSFSPQGDELNKGLLLFAEPEPLENDEDIQWFFIAGAEFAGIDKVSFADCIAWVEDNKSNILDTAAQPLDMVDWWANLDAPFEFLAWCFEYQKLQKYLEEHNGHAKGFITGISIAFDGTCSGLQHFSAILRDPIGAKEVNLAPGDKPNDIYQTVADKVNCVLEQDAKTGTGDTTNDHDKIKYGTKTLAQGWLSFGVNRKVTKRPVMTLAYGAKQFGFRDQILEDTIVMHIGEGLFTPDNANQYAGYMAKLIWDAVQTTVIKAVQGMEWLQKAARIVTKNGEVIQWTTPMGFIVQQPYMVYQVKTFKMRFLHIIKRFYDAEMTGTVDRRKQSQAIAPNFIHSMDASHLQLTVNRAVEAKISNFAMIHDSYGTSLAKAGLLFHLIRECFVEMYTTNDVLTAFERDISPFIMDKQKLPPQPTKGTFDIDQIKESLYAFH
jgi:RNA polymerase|nr:MAG TPA: DNA directed RNA polymerase [Caudoviricetes sp.]